MAGSRIVARLCSRLSSSSPKLNSTRAAPSGTPFKSAAQSVPSAASANRSFSISSVDRLPELRCLVSMMPLHSAIASARLTSILSSESQSWGLIPQGNSMPL